MRGKLEDAPWWVWSMIMGISFGAVTTVFNRLQQPSSWTAALVGGLIGGVFFGAVMGPLVVRQRRKVLALLGDLPRRDLRIAGRAVNRGLPPRDPDIRRVAVLLATQQLNESARLRWLGLVLFSLFAVLSAILALTDSPWWWVAVAFHATFFAGYLMWPRHLRRRIAILSQDQ